MKTLVIHPCDITTNFLEVIYRDNPHWTVYRQSKSSSWSNSKLRKQIAAHDQIIMLGHGDNKGLHGVRGYIVDSKLVYVLKQKYCVCIWCYADQFVNKYKLNGIYTGMIISEWEEAEYLSVRCTYQEVFASNLLFAEVMKQSVQVGNITPAKDYYDLKIPVIEYNKDHIYINQERNDFEDMELALEIYGDMYQR